MDAAATVAVATRATTPSAASALLRDVFDLYKVRLSSLVLVTTGVGYLLSRAGPLDFWHLVVTLLGTALAAFGANGLNQCLEVDRDARMPRTRNRPLPAGRMSLRAGVGYSLLAAITGPGLLLLAHPLAALLALLTELIYLFVYTPLKPRTSLNTLVGAIVGALPPMIGWAAATGGLTLGAWLLAAILFVWQIPHFLALAWMYRHDYELGGYRMLPSLDPAGALTCQAILLYNLALVPLSTTVGIIGLTGWAYAFGSIVLGVLFLLIGVDLYFQRSRENARRLFLASVVYLPLLLGLMVMDRRSPVPNLRLELQPLTSVTDGNVTQP